ncbi:MAG: hypothetical protein AAFX79_00025 [Planctomycetota bacterium]
MRWHLAEAAVGAAGLCSVAFLAAWAFSSHAPRVPLVAPTPIESGTAAPPKESDELLAVDPRHFDVALWNPPPPPPPPPPRVREPVIATTRVEPLRVELLAIVHRRDDNVLAALMYDPAADALLTLVEGDKVGGHVVELIDDEGVRFAAGQTQTLLTLYAEDRR